MNQIVKLYNKGKHQLDVKGKFKQLIEDILEEKPRLGLLMWPQWYKP